MLRKIRILLALLFFAAVTLLFLDFTGTLHAWLGWTARVQFLPALMAMNLGVVALLVALTLVAGRIYCSVICPLGVLQDIFTHLGGLGPKKKRYRFSYSPALQWLRYVMLALFAAAMVAGVGSFVALLAPYSSYGRIAANLFAPVYDWINNLLAIAAERMDSYAFYKVDVWVRSIPVFVIAAVTFAALAVLAWRNGRTYCNTICPVGTVLGVLSRFSLFGIRISKESCVSCGLCSRRCKSACIDGGRHKVDYSRCVACMDCISECSHGAISYGLRHKGNRGNRGNKEDKGIRDNGGMPADGGRRAFLIGAAAAAVGAAHAQATKVDGGLAVIEEKKVPKRAIPVLPPGAVSLRHLARHCTGCQLCVAECPNGVLRPSSGLLTLMQPESSYERGYCRPECTRCSEVCPTGAIIPISKAEKASTRIGHAVWVMENCLILTEGVSCGNCARHCPSGAILMVPMHAGDPGSPLIPAVNESRCIGCGACENLCPARPFSAIYVEGVERQSEI